MEYEIIVVGAGHAGCEAAYACAHKKHKTLLITLNKNNIADMPCNPSIGGTAKGIVVREIDALGGIMGVVADESLFQIKMLNSTKGPAVRSLRAQADKVTYPKNMLKHLNKEKYLTILEGNVEKLIVNNGLIKGVVLDSEKEIEAQIVILTTGTYLKAQILRGSNKNVGGPHGEKTSKLSDNLKELGLHIQRLKTGTPPRIKKDSIDFSTMQEEKGDNIFLSFSHDYKPKYDIANQQSCYLLYTNENTKKIIEKNLKKSAMYGGYVEGIGPRYCPSIEDKIVRFNDKDRHQLFLEPESIFYDDWYLQGFSTSMPIDVQEELVHSLNGLEKAIITKYAYAIEYDAIDPLQINSTLENKVIHNLYTAGQINGTSGYEEAAAQGLIAGINASLKIENKEPLLLKRNEAYIGVLIDDLVTKGTKEPYRLLTSRAEYRLILRHDNADLRLREYGYRVGLISNKQYLKLIRKKEDLVKIKDYLEKTSLNISLEDQKKYNFKNNIKLINALKRPEISIDILDKIHALPFSKDLLSIIETEIKYEGYIKKTTNEVAKMLKLENKMIPKDIDYNKIINLANEAKEKLILIKPLSIGQASRISGVNPTDIAVLSVYLKKEYPNE